MKAIVRYQYGSPDVLTLAEVDNPVVKDQDVLVRVRAGSLNADDLEYLFGKSPFTRIAAGLRKPRLRGLDEDVAAQVEAGSNKSTPVMKRNDAREKLTCSQL